MPLVTLAERLLMIVTRLGQVERAAKDAMEYAERTARMHHEAICRLNELAGRGHCWPPKS
jgi:hypothetical protein